MGEGGKREVEIVVKTVGPSRPTKIRIESPIEVVELRKVVAAKGCHSLSHLKLVFCGRTLPDESTGGIEDSVVRFEDGDTLVAAIMPRPPPKHLHEDDEDEDDEDLKFHIPESEKLWKRRLLYFLQRKMKFPDILLMVIFSISIKAWIGIILWFSLAHIVYRWDLGPIYILATGFAAILLNLGKRKQGDASAYSIFNEDFRELPGTYNANRVDRDIRAGQF
ncbi:hypothetical protein ZOSMA_181G00340 [Zostera marina]|uniref:Ubiquitin-like domain-containing protein n=1 Tax=Zostera marina TaxID=29655 RepID=A0A0K9PR06_ZOSMR|nr:hypothetical protein ZOSMA_181G00340 [Zostera marina]